MPCNNDDLLVQIVPRSVRRMQNFLRTILENQKLASHVKILRLYRFWATDARQWLAKRKVERGEYRVWAVVETALHGASSPTGEVSRDTALLLRTFPNLEVLEIAWRRVDVDLARRKVAEAERAWGGLWWTE